MAKKVTFEQALQQLEQIVSDIESGQVPLEESIEKYAQGTKLVKQCRDILTSAEQKIQLLAKGDNNTVTPSGELPDQDEAAE